VTTQRLYSNFRQLITEQEVWQLDWLGDSKTLALSTTFMSNSKQIQQMTMDKLQATTSVILAYTKKNASHIYTTQ
jgi:hypothetical protein